MLDILCTNFIYNLKKLLLPLDKNLKVNLAVLTL